MLSRGASGINARGALLHVFGDLLGSVAALVAGAVIYRTGWTPIDPILSLVVALLILRSTLALLQESTGVLLERRARAPVVRGGRPRAGGAPRRDRRPRSARVAR